MGEKFTLPIKNNKRVNANKVLGSEPQMPADIIPIKTYVDYGMDKNPKDEYIIDPLLSILE
ncbi:MAG: hypothetical protein QM532_00710 [Cyanobium sp. MAG06]|nr:hypothetical protein [Cyanobium sp. MAG06]